MDLTKFAEFITALGSLNGYASTIAETKRALEMRNAQVLTRGQNDAIIFADAVKAIDAVHELPLTVDTIIQINKSFDGGGDEQPTMPGHLRNDVYNPELDSVSVIVNEVTQEAYFAQGVITREDIQTIIDEWQNSLKLGEDAWRLFARLAKLQPFQDGNNRTALIAANLAFGAYSTDNYLLIPARTADRYRFTADLMDYYVANNAEDAEVVFQRMLSWVDGNQLDSPSFSPSYTDRQFNAQTTVYPTEQKPTSEAIADLFNQETVD